MRFALPANDHLTRELVRALDDERESYGTTCRAVGDAAQRLGLRRPSYELVRRLAGQERLRRERERAVRRARRDVAAAFFLSSRVVDTPIALDRLALAKRDASLVTQWHEASSDGDDAVSVRP